MAHQNVQGLVQNLLAGLNYGERSAVQIQILQLLHQLVSLKPSVDNYVFNDGTQQKLFKLAGTIPIQYRSATYNIPVALWLPLNFPKNCPICYVTPIPSMRIKQKHMHVDQQGLIYHPYLHSWKQHTSTLSELVGLLCSVFGKEPPLFSAKQKTQPNVLNVNARPPQARPQPRVQPMQPVQPRQQPVAVQQPAPAVQQAQAQAQAQGDEFDTALRKVLQGMYDKENDKLNALASAQRQLDGHAAKIKELQSAQTQERDALLQRRQNLQIKIEATEQWLATNEKKQALVMDEVVVTCDTWSQQCIEATATEFAITDAMLELDRCLEEEVISLETYLKLISRMAREQFHAKALAKTVFKKQNQLVMQNR